MTDGSVTIRACSSLHTDCLRSCSRANQQVDCWKCIDRFYLQKALDTESSASLSKATIRADTVTVVAMPFFVLVMA